MAPVLERKRCFRCAATLTVDEAEAVANAIADVEGDWIVTLFDGDDRAEYDCRLDNGDTVVCTSCVAAVRGVVVAEVDPTTFRSLSEPDYSVNHSS